MSKPLNGKSFTLTAPLKCILVDISLLALRSVNREMRDVYRDLPVDCRPRRILYLTGAWDVVSPKRRLRIHNFSYGGSSPSLPRPMTQDVSDIFRGMSSLVKIVSLDGFPKGVTWDMLARVGCQIWITEYPGSPADRPGRHPLKCDLASPSVRACLGRVESLELQLGAVLRIGNNKSLNHLLELFELCSSLKVATLIIDEALSSHPSMLAAIMDRILPRLACVRVLTLTGRFPLGEMKVWPPRLRSLFLTVPSDDTLDFTEIGSIEILALYVSIKPEYFPVGCVDLTRLKLPAQLRDLRVHLSATDYKLDMVAMRGRREGTVNFQTLVKNYKTV